MQSSSPSNIHRARKKLGLKRNSETNIFIAKVPKVNHNYRLGVVPYKTKTQLEDYEPNAE